MLDTLDRRVAPEQVRSEGAHLVSASAARRADGARRLGRPPVALWLLLAVFGLSNALFLARAMAASWAAAALILVLFAALAWLFQAREPGRRDAIMLEDFRWPAVCTVMALGLCLLGGQGRLLFAPEDWQVRDAVLADMGRGAWPVVYRLKDHDWILRCPVGFYEIPALVGRIIGLRAAHWALLAQDTLVMAAVLHLFTANAGAAWRRWLIVAVFVFFSGMDITGQAMVWGLQAVIGQAPAFGLHIERWIGDLEYSSFLTDLFWAPNHGLPAFAFVAAYLCWRDRAISAPALAAFAALGFVWSPLAVMGMAPFVLFALWTDWRAGALKMPELALAVAAGIPLLPGVIYSHLASRTVVHGFTFVEGGSFWLSFLLFAAYEIVPLLYLMMRSGHGQTRTSKAETVIVAALLLLIPLYGIGSANDFMMRASIVPLALMAFTIAERAISCVEHRLKTQLAFMAAILLIGAVTPALEIARAFAHPPEPIVTAPVPDAWAQSVFHEVSADAYLAPAESLRAWSWLLKAPPAG